MSLNSVPYLYSDDSFMSGLLNSIYNLGQVGLCVCNSSIDAS